MSPVRVTWHRTIGRTRSLYSTAFAVGAFLAASAALFAFKLDAAEGVSLSVASVWAMGVAPFLPALAAILAMDVWSDELQSGRIELLLTTPVREREFTLGKFLGVFTMLVFATFLSFASTVIALRVYAPSTLAGIGVLGFCPASCRGGGVCVASPADRHSPRRMGRAPRLGAAGQASVRRDAS